MYSMLGSYVGINGLRSYNRLFFALTSSSLPAGILATLTLNERSTLAPWTMMSFATAWMWARMMPTQVLIPCQKPILSTVGMVDNCGQLSCTTKYTLKPPIGQNIYVRTYGQSRVS